MSADTAGWLRLKLEEEGLMAGAWSNGPGDRYMAHRHDYDKVLVAAAGSIEFQLPELGETVPLTTGDRLDLPAGTLHGALVGSRGVTCLEAHPAAGTLPAGLRRLPGWGLDQDTGRPQDSRSSEATETDPAGAA
jgi:quercetin dioxygenase-like cupin family protein